MGASVLMEALSAIPTKNASENCRLDRHLIFYVGYPGQELAARYVRVSDRAAIRRSVVACRSRN